MRSPARPLGGGGSRTGAGLPFVRPRFVRLPFVRLRFVRRRRDRRRAGFARPRAAATAAALPRELALRLELLRRRRERELAARAPALVDVPSAPARGGAEAEEVERLGELLAE